MGWEPWNLLKPILALPQSKKYTDPETGPRSKFFHGIQELMLSGFNVWNIKFVGEHIPDIIQKAKKKLA